MRILLSAYACEPHRGSEPGNGWNTAYYLALRGHVVHVLTRIASKEIIQKELEQLSLPNLRFHFVDIPKIHKYFIRGQIGVYLHYLSWQHQAYKYARQLENDVDIIHHRTWSSLHGGSELWKLSKPFLWGPIGGGQIAPDALLSFFEEEKLTEKFRSFVTNHYSVFFPVAASAARNSEIIITANRETKDLLEKSGAKQVLLGLDSSLEKEFIPLRCPMHNKSDKLKILWVGRVYPRKGLNLVLKTLGRVKIPFEFSIVGDGPWGHKISGWISEYNLDGKVKWYGQLPWEDLKKIYEENDVFFYTSLRESFGSQLLEAMAFGLPVITLDCFGARDFIPDEAGLKIKVTTMEETLNNLVAAVEHLWENSDNRRKKGVKAYQFAIENTWDNHIRQYEKIYNDCITRVGLK